MEQKKENVKWLYHDSTDHLCATEPIIGLIQGVHQLARAKYKEDPRKSKEDFANYKDIKI